MCRHGTAARSPRRATLCFRDWLTDGSSRSTQRPAKNCGKSPTGTGIVAGPATYLVDGVQYVSIAVGWGGVFGVSERINDKEGPGTVFTFAIGGKAPLPEFSKVQLAGLISGIQYNKDDVGPGLLLYVSNCVVCHGVPGGKGGNVSNLGFVAPGIDRQSGSPCVQGPAHEPRHAGLHRQAEAGRRDQAQGVHRRHADAIRPKQ